MGTSAADRVAAATVSVEKGVADRVIGIGREG
jgi:hypothetical protein